MVFSQSDDHAQSAAREFLGTCGFVDLEAEPGRIFKIGALHGERTFLRSGPFSPGKALKELDIFLSGCRFVAGHNLIGHDWPILRASAPDLECLQLPLIDTLYLSPLAFPENPYHALIKDYKLVRAAVSNPVGDCRLARSVLADEWSSLHGLSRGDDAKSLAFFRYCLSDHATQHSVEQLGFGGFFDELGVHRIDRGSASRIFVEQTEGKVCKAAVRRVFFGGEGQPAWEALAYCLAWLRVSGGSSVLPPWVRHNFPDTVGLLKALRDVPCGDSGCEYCAEQHDPAVQLKRYFDFDAFRQQPATVEGNSLQEEIVLAGMSGDPLLAILPTGGGKSLCFQLPALVRHFRRGQLTVVLSPLQALMKDQVENLTLKTGCPSAAAIYGMLTPPERGDVLERTRLGDISILYVSPEQLRNKSFRKTIAQREIGCWVFDEAHCLSKWGHDFRPDYLYATRFIREFAKEQGGPTPPVACFTATAKLDVIQEIRTHFRDELGQELRLFQGSFERANLRFEVEAVREAEKLQRVHDLLRDRLNGHGSAVVYAATRNGAEDAAKFLAAKRVNARPFHAGLEVPVKRETQDSFIRGETRVICATNAFGMGIDKDDVRLVIHINMPGSLEDYLQEAGRAGRDNADADCVLLFCEDDLETQFRLSAMSRLHHRDLVQILRSVRRSKRKLDDIIVTPKELLRVNPTSSIDSEEKSADTKVKTAVAWLERAGFLERNENQTNVFQGKPAVKTIEEARERVAALGLSQKKTRQWMAILTMLFNAEPRDGISAEDLATHAGFRDGGDVPNDTRQRESASRQVIRTLHDMAAAGILNEGLLLTAFVRHKIADSSLQRLEQVSRVETAMLDMLQELAPDTDVGEWQQLSVRRLNQALLDNGQESSVEMIRNLLDSLSRDGKGFAEGMGTLEFRHSHQDHYRVKLHRDWPSACRTSEKRRALAEIILKAILDKIPAETSPGKDLLVEFTSNDLAEAIRQDMFMAGQVRDMLAAIDRGLMYLHEQKVIILQNGLAIFRQAMRIRLSPQAKGRRYTRGDYQPLAEHYLERTQQVHVMAAYAERALVSVTDGLGLIADYFKSSRRQFVERYFAGQEPAIQRAISQEAFEQIVDGLGNPVQVAVVAGREDANMLVLAGPGSGKTKVVVHRVAYLVRVLRIPASSILVICFNRHAAVELRARLRDLIGRQGLFVTVATYHSLAMRLTGHSFADHVSKSGEALDLDELIPSATRLLRGEVSMPGAEADEIRDKVLAGFSFILVDEYQDINADQYELISALTDRTGKDPDTKLSILAVGDDDQNIYSFRGTNVEFIRRFEQDYGARTQFLVQNYRSSDYIIRASNDLIRQNRDRMKTEHPIVIDKRRAMKPPGGDWEALDPVSRGQCQMLKLRAEDHESVALVTELQRLHSIKPDQDWGSFAVLSRTRYFLHAVRALCEHRGIPVRWSLHGGVPQLFQIREIASFLDQLKELRQKHLTGSELIELLRRGGPSSENHWTHELQQLLETWREDTANAPTPVNHVVEHLYEALGEQKREPSVGRGVFLGTIHAAKGMEFDHVLIPSAGWSRSRSRQEEEEERRLLYVGMTRARQTLTLTEGGPSRPPLGRTNGSFIHRPAAERNGVPPELLNRSYEILGPGDLYLGFASQRPPHDRIHAALGSLQPGDLLNHACRGDHVELTDNNGLPIARLSKDAAEAWRKRLPHANELRILAMIRREKSHTQPEFRDRCRCDTWEVPVVEVVLGAAPDPE